MSISLIITDAGRAEVINADNTGTGPVTLTEVALGTGVAASSQTQTALQAEFKRLSTISGLVVADDTIHVTVRDETNAEYSFSEFGIFTDSGTLFAVYSAPADIMQKAADSSLNMALDVVLGTLDANTVTFGDTNFANPPASETVPGVAVLATTTEALGGTNDAKSMTPLKVAKKVELEIGSILTGTVNAFAMPTAPSGWIKCNGAALDRTIYTNLFSALGTTFGAGDGSTTFNIPDLRGEFVRGFDDGRGIDTARLLGSYQADELASHTHLFERSSDGGGGAGGDTGNSWNGQYRETEATGGSETRPRNIALLYCIKY